MSNLVWESTFLSSDFQMYVFNENLYHLDQLNHNNSVSTPAFNTTK